MTAAKPTPTLEEIVEGMVHAQCWAASLHYRGKKCDEKDCRAAGKCCLPVTADNPMRAALRYFAAHGLALVPLRLSAVNNDGLNQAVATANILAALKTEETKT